VCSATDWLCSYCCCRSGMRGGAALFKCSDCVRDYSADYICKHHTFIEGKEHKVNNVLQDVRDSEIEVRTSGWALHKLWDTAENYLIAVKKDMLAGISTCSTSHPGCPRPLCTSLPSLLKLALDATVLCAAPCAAVIAASRAEATMARDRESKDEEALAALAATTASTTGPAVTAATTAHRAVLRCKEVLDSALKTELRRKTAQNVAAYKRAKTSFEKAIQLLQKAVVSVGKIFMLCHSLQVSSELATKSVKEVTGNWQIELDTIVTQPSSKAGVRELRHHVTTVLRLPLTRQGDSTELCLKPALEDVLF
jgi:hypothetical protein